MFESFFPKPKNITTDLVITSIIFWFLSGSIATSLLTDQIPFYTVVTEFTYTKLLLFILSIIYSFGGCFLIIYYINALFLLSAIGYTVFVISIYYEYSDFLSNIIGLKLADEGSPPVIGLGYFATNDFIWFDIYFVFSVILFYLFWSTFSPHKWQIWSIFGSALIIFMTYFTVQVSVVINFWYEPFYNDIQTALTGNGEVTGTDLYMHLLTFCVIVAPYILFVPFKIFFNQHYLFRWRNAMNDFYTERWKQLRHIEGASQRIQEDTKQFSRLMKNVGTYMIDSIMTLIAFIPVLAALSIHVESIPILGSIPYSLVFLALFWSIFGTVLFLLAGIKLPGLEFKNERVEAAFRKELVLGEDTEKRADLPTVNQLFSNLRKNYFKLYFHYSYFNIIRYIYIQADNIIVYIFLIPTIASGKITLGIMTQITRAFGQVANSFQFLANSWPTIIELMSIYKRLQAFESVIYKKELPKIDQEFMKTQRED